MEIKEIKVKDIPRWSVDETVSNPIIPSLNNQIRFEGFPSIRMPGCVRARTVRNKSLVEKDPKGNLLICDGPVFETPSFNVDSVANSQEVENQETEEKPVIVPPLKNIPKTDKKTKNKQKKKEAKENSGDLENNDLSNGFSSLDLNKQIKINLPCPRPDDLSIGSKGKFGRARVKGHELNSNNECVTLWEEIPVLETVNTYLPPPPLVLTTGAVAATAVTASVLVKPLSDYLLKIVKPLVKKITKKVLAKVGKKQKVLSLFERRKQQRQNR